MLLPLFFLSISFAAAAAKPVDSFRFLYFFSGTCEFCAEALPRVTGLSREFQVQGLCYGKKEVSGLPFPVSKGKKGMAAPYGVMGVPALVMLNGDTTIQVFNGSDEIAQALPMARAFRNGALPVSRAFEARKGSVTIAGWAESLPGEKAGRQVLYVGDHRKRIALDGVAEGKFPVGATVLVSGTLLESKNQPLLKVKTVKKLSEQ